MTLSVYLDYNATAPLEEEAFRAMEPYLRDKFGNASSLHGYGRDARRAVEEAREKVANAVGAHPDEVVFTSSGTESNNTIIKGVATMSLRGLVAVSGTEHPCVLCAARALGRGGVGYVPLAVRENGLIDPDDLNEVLKNQDCALVSVMLANNETGVLQDIKSVAALARETETVSHTDAAQAVGKIAVNFADLDVDAMTVSAHKAGGPKGVAALVVRRGVDWTPLMDGGGHENGRRAGTENVAGIVGMGAAFELAAKRQAAVAAHLTELRDNMENALRQLGAIIFAADTPRLPNTSLFGFDKIDGESLVVMLDQSGFAVSSGAACSNMKEEPSHVLLAMGVEKRIAQTAVRASLGAATKNDDINRFVAVTDEIIKRLRNLSAMSGE